MKRIPFPFAAAVLLIPALAASAAAQDGMSRGEASAMVGGAEVSVDYGRPSLGDRSLDELLAMLPEDRIWRAGENQVTLFSTSGDIRIGGEAVPAGTYSLYLHIPDSGDWSLVLNRHQGIRLGDLSSQAPEAMHDEMWPMMSGYGEIEDQEAARIPLESMDSGMAADAFSIEIEDGMIRFAWGDAAYQTAISGG